MANTHKAMQVTRAGVLELVERETPAPGEGEVLIPVHACGICGADSGVVEGLETGLQFPRVPGHEVVGRIVALGAGTSNIWRVGQRVGVGRLGGHCNVCVQCRQAHFNLCNDQPITGSTQDGGYAHMMIAHATGLVTIPDALASVEAAPLLCAGIATFNALRKSGAGAGDLVAIQGIGGLGHLALQYARRMGFKVIAIGRGADIAAAGAATRSSSLHRHSGIRQAMAVPRGHDVAAAYVRDFVERKKTEGFIRAALDESGQADATAAPSV